jgi:hypothetical protein
MVRHRPVSPSESCERLLFALSGRAGPMLPVCLHIPGLDRQADDGRSNLSGSLRRGMGFFLRLASFQTRAHCLLTPERFLARFCLTYGLSAPVFGPRLNLVVEINLVLADGVSGP